MKNKMYAKTAVVMTAVVFLLMLSLPGSAAAMQEKEYFKLKNLDKILEKSLDFDFDFDIVLSHMADFDFDMDLGDLNLDIKKMVGESREKYKEKFDKTVALAKDGKVEVSNVSGDIEIKTWDRNEVKIDALKVSKANTKEKAKANADLVKIVVTKEDGLVRVKTEYPKNNKNRNLSVSITYNLMVPKGASPSVNTVSGDIVVADIGGDVKASAVSGEVKLGKVGGGVKAKSVSGGVVLQGAKNGAHCEVVSGMIKVSDVTGDVSVKGVSGDIELTDIRGNLTASTTSGEIYMKNINEAETVKAKILSGDLKYEGDIMASGVYEFQSHSGDVTLLIPAGTAFDLEAKTFSGSIDSDFDLTISGKISKKSIKGKANGGGADIEVQTFSGDVKIRKK
jgi:hypothetical protein